LRFEKQVGVCAAPVELVAGAAQKPCFIF